MVVKFYLPPPDESIRSNLLRIGIFIQELEFIRELVHKRINEINIEKKKRYENLPEPDFEITNFSGPFTEFRLNLFIKSFFFITRQATAKILRICYQIRKDVGNKKTEIPDASQNEKFTSFIENLLDGKYDTYEPKLISLLKEKINLLILTRIIRNQLKYFGDFPILNSGKVWKIIIPLGKDYVEKEPLIKRSTYKFSVDYKDLKNLGFEIDYLDILIQDIKLIYETLKTIIVSLPKNSNPETKACTPSQYPPY